MSRTDTHRKNHRARAVKYGFRTVHRIDIGADEAPVLMREVSAGCDLDSATADSHYGRAAGDFADVLANGDPEAASEIMRYVDGMRFDEIDAERTVWELAPYGSSPCVPAHLAGLPCDMRRSVREHDDAAPCRIFLGLTTAGGYDAADVRTRAACAVALALAIGRDRPVELYAYCTGRIAQSDRLLVCRMGCSPLDAGRLSSLATVEWQRRLGFAAMRAAHSKTSGMIRWNDTPDGELVGATKDDIVLSGQRWNDRGGLLEDPAGWVERTARNYYRKQREGAR